MLLLTNTKLLISQLGLLEVCSATISAFHTRTFRRCFVRRSERQFYWTRQRFLQTAYDMLYTILIFQKCIITAFFGCNATFGFNEGSHT